MRAGSVVFVCVAVLLGVIAGPAIAEPGSGPRGTVDQRFTAKRPATPTGLGFTGTYHAEGDKKKDPPYMRRMTFYPPAGMRYDTSVPEQCTANDFELSQSGPEACPEGSIIGEGTTSGVFFVPFTLDQVVLDRYTHKVYIANNKDEQIVLVEAEGYAVVRGKFQPDGSIEFNSPTCFPTPPTGCVTDHVLQTGSKTFVARYVKDGKSYATTPPRCPASRHWVSKVRFWWADGAVDTLVTRQPCRRPKR